MPQTRPGQPLAPYKCLKPPNHLLPSREALASFNARQLRLMFCLQPWNKTMMYGEQSRTEMKVREAQLRNFFGNVDAAIRNSSVNTNEQRWTVSLGGQGRGVGAGWIRAGGRHGMRLGHCQCAGGAVLGTGPRLRGAGA